MSRTHTAPAKLTKEQGIDHLAELREDYAMALAETYAAQQRIHRGLAVTAVLWRAISGEEAPEIEVTPMVRRIRERAA